MCYDCPKSLSQTHNTLTACIKFNLMIILLLADIYASCFKTWHVDLK